MLTNKPTSRSVPEGRRKLGQTVERCEGNDRGNNSVLPVRARGGEQCVTERLGRLTSIDREGGVARDADLARGHAV